MRSSRKSKLAAVCVFVLIASVVLGGMSWATVSSFRLAKQTALEERAQRLSEAVWRMDSYIGGILYAETDREYDEYKRLQTKKTIAVIGDDGIETGGRLAVLLSPLATSVPRHKWIELYFQVDKEGIASSPHISEDNALWPSETQCPCGDARCCSRPAWEWFKSSLAAFDLGRRVSQAMVSHRGPSTSSEDDEEADTDTDSPQVQLAGDRERSDRAQDEFTQRKRSLRDSQATYLRRPECIEADIAARNSLSTGGLGSELEDNASMAGTGGVEVRQGPFVSLWFEPGMEGERKLAFVRECRYDANVFHQGFLGDWVGLKADLLTVIADTLPDGDLDPVPEGTQPDLKNRSYQLTNLPVRLHAPDIPGGAAAAAWKSIRGTVIATWMAAGAVLIVAGMGLRSLVALTERRMQFAYAVTHELRTPLTTFRLYSDMLSANLVPEASKQQYLDTLNTESLRLSSLVEGVLEYARLENQRVRLNPTETNGASLLDAAASNLKSRCRENDIEAIVRNEVDDRRTIRTDVDVVHRIVGVLVNNACRHARGSIKPTVAVHLSGDHGCVHLDVMDTGPGIDRADARAIFKPFRRGHRADETAQGGIGLGLALANSWAGLLGGRLELVARHHAKYGGAHFRLTIPDRLDS